MTDGNTEWDTSSAEPAGRRPRRVNRMLGAGLALVLLAAVGAVGGYLLAGGGDDGAQTAAGSASPAATPSSRPATATTTRPDSPPAASRTTAPGGTALPDLVGEDFEKARDELRERKLGWQLIFGSGEDREVLRTDPAPGALVRRGLTVKVYVAGAAPVEEVPDLVGESCGEAANELVDDGFSPQYPTGRSGQVVEQDPPADSERRWNDPVKIFCGSVPPTMLSTPPAR